MEVMEDGNLMDKVNILIQRDMEYYKVGYELVEISFFYISEIVTDVIV